MLSEQIVFAILLALNAMTGCAGRSSAGVRAIKSLHYKA